MGTERPSKAFVATELKVRGMTKTDRRATIRPVMGSVRSYQTWQAERPLSECWAQLVNGAMGTYRRERPRDPDEARLLASRGTPVSLIGPVAARQS